MSSFEYIGGPGAVIGDTIGAMGATLQRARQQQFENQVSEQNAQTEAEKAQYGYLGKSYAADQQRAARENAASITANSRISDTAMNNMTRATTGQNNAFKDYVDTLTASGLTSSDPAYSAGVNNFWENINKYHSDATAQTPSAPPQTPSTPGPPGFYSSDVVAARADPSQIDGSVAYGNNPGLSRALAPGQPGPLITPQGEAIVPPKRLPAPVNIMPPQSPIAAPPPMRPGQGSINAPMGGSPVPGGIPTIPPSLSMFTPPTQATVRQATPDQMSAAHVAYQQAPGAPQLTPASDPYAGLTPDAKAKLLAAQAQQLRANTVASEAPSVISLRAAQSKKALADAGFLAAKTGAYPALTNAIINMDKARASSLLSGAGTRAAMVGIAQQRLGLSSQALQYREQVDPNTKTALQVYAIGMKYKENPAYYGGIDPNTIASVDAETSQAASYLMRTVPSQGNAPTPGGQTGNNVPYRPTTGALLKKYGY